MRLIDADAFKSYMRNALEQTRDVYPDKGEWAETITEQFCIDIDEQPTVTELRWIPCSERLPENSNFYIVTRKDFLVGCMWYSVMHGWEWQEEEQPVAWMPLPEPWKEEANEMR